MTRLELGVILLFAIFVYGGLYRLVQWAFE